MMKISLRCFWVLLLCGMSYWAVAQPNQVTRSAGASLSVGQVSTSQMRSASPVSMVQGPFAPSADMMQSSKPTFGANVGGQMMTATTSCGPDTVYYPLAKTSTLRTLSFGGGTAFGQWYPAPQSITINGMSFYAFVDSATNASINLLCEVYSAGPDSLPTGPPLASATISIDSNFYNGSLAQLEKHVAFASPVTVTGPYVMVVQNSSTISAAIVVSDYLGLPPDGLQEWLANVQINGTWFNSRDVTIASIPFDADVLIHPHVTYDLTADFQPNPAFGCANIPATMLNNSSPILFSRFYSIAAFVGQPSLSCTWNFGDGSPLQNLVDANHTYALPGPYTVTLTDTLFGWTTNCVDVLAGSINVATGVAVSSNFTSTTSGLTATFTDASTGGPVAWLWDFGDGNTSNLQSPAHTYAMNGTYTVCLTAVNVCGVDTFCQTILVGAAPIASCDTFTNISGTPTLFPAVGGGYVAGHNSFLDSAKADKFTLGNPFAFQEALYLFGHKESPTPATSKVIATVWDATGAGGSPGAVLATQDLFYNQIDTTGAFTSVFFPTIINTNGSFFVGIQLIYAAGDTVALITNQNGQTVPATAWELWSGGSPWLPYDDSQSWGLDISHGIFVVQAVEANFSQTTAGLTATFTDQSAGAMGVAWDFGDGNTSTAQNPTHTYAAPGTYTVCQVAFNGNCADTTCMPVTVGGCQPPVAAFTSLVNGNVVDFTDQSSSTDSIITWVWDFGDGGSSTAQNPTNTYAVPGTYTVCLTVTDSCGSDTICSTVVITCVPPVANLNGIVTGNTVLFGDQSSGSPTSWFWTFGDGGTSTNQNPLYTYATADTFLVCLVATNACGSDTFCDSIITGCNTPIAQFTDSTNNLTVVFTDQSLQGPAAWFWDFGDGNTSTTPSPTHTYATAGTYQVCLTVSNSCGSTTTCSTYVVTCQTAVPNYSFVTAGLQVSFTDLSTGNPSAWFWVFGDGATALAQNPSHTYTTAGTYTVCLVVSNSCGQDTLCGNINIVCPTPNSAFSFTNSNQSYTFSDQSSGNPNAWFWDFGDGNTSTLQNPTHLYASLGTFNVCLTTSNSCGSNTFCTPVVVTCPTPNPNFSFVTNQLGVTFTNLTSGNANAWQWDFGDGSGFSTQQNPSYTYSAPGIYTVCLTAINNCGGDSVCININVTCPAPTANFNFTTVGNNASFTDQSSSSAVNWFWDFGDGNTSTAQNPTHTYSAVGTYNVCLVTGSQCGTDTSCSPVIINCVPPVAGFTSSTTQDSIVVFANTASPNSAAWFWDFGDGSTSTQANPTHVYQGPGTYTVCQTVTNTCGTNTICSTVTITCVNPSSGFTAQLTNSQAVFQSNSILAVSYLWDFGDGNTSTQQNPTHVYSASGVFQVCLTVSNFCGSNTSCQNLVVTCNKPSPNFSAANGNGVVNFTDLSGNLPTVWEWNFGDGGTSTLQNPSHGFLFTGQFNVCLRVRNACGTRDTCMMVNVTTVDLAEAVVIEESFELWPNPTGGQFQLQVDLPKALDVRVRLTNVLGQELFRSEEGRHAGVFQQRYDLGALAAGTYMLEFSAGEHRIFRKLVVD